VFEPSLCVFHASFTSNTISKNKPGMMIPIYNLSCTGP
jgi:hypothetical protein